MNSNIDIARQKLYNSVIARSQWHSITNFIILLLSFLLVMTFNVKAQSSSFPCASGTLTSQNGYYGGFEAGGVNGINNFSVGAASTEYTYGDGQREYQILSNTDGQSGYLPLEPHSGNFFLTSHTAASNPHLKLWFKTLSVVPGQRFQICAWIANLKVNPVGGFPVNIVVNTASGITVIATRSAVTNTWEQICGTYTVPAGVTSIEFEIEDPTPNFNGSSHFLALDDICLTEVSNVNLGNTVWYDQNNDGIKQGMETGIVEATVKLYADANNDNVADGAAIATTTTNASGVYNFTNLVGGNYIVGVTIPAGYAVVTTNGGDPDNNTDNDNNGTNTGVTGEVRSSAITLASGTEPTTDGDGANGNQTLDFGFKGAGSIGDFVFNDANANGIQNAGEVGIPNATVTLTYPNGATVSTSTNASGIYSFPNLAPGSYSVAFTTPAGFTPTVSNIGANDAADSDPIAGIVNGIVLTAGQINNTIDAGFYQANLSLGNNVWNDQNNDGIKQATETGIANVTVNLYTDNDNDDYPDTTAAGDEILLMSTLTDAAGNYIFNNLTPGNYIVGVVSPSGFMRVAINGGDPDDNINLDNNGIYSISGGETFGLAITLATGTEPNGSSTNTNYNDTYDFGFTPSSISPTFCTGTLLTNANGYYGGFEIIPASLNLGPVSNPNPAGSELTLVFSGNISADKAIIASNGRSIPGGISLPPHSGNWLLLLHPKRNNERLWFKSVSVTPGSTYTFCAWGAGSKATPATMTLNLFMNGVNVGTGTITNAGTWTQVCGTYTVPAGVTTMEISIQDPTAGDGGPSHFVALDDICFTQVTNLNLGNTVWYDQNNDGIKQISESGIAGVTVRLYADDNNDNIADGAAIATTTTDLNGVYNFTALGGGTYIVGVTIPAGYAVVTTNGGDPDNNLDNDNNGTNTSVTGEVRSSAITLSAGTEPTTDGDGANGNLTLDFALKGTGSIGNFVWNDLNRNGIQDAGEPGLPNVTVTLTNPDGTTTTTITDANGAYIFSGLLPGSYNLSFSTPTGGYIASPSNSGSNDEIDSDPVNGTVSNIVLTAGEINNSIDAGFIKLVSLTGNVWHDVNGMSDNLVNNSGAMATPPAASVPTGLRITRVDANTGLVIDVALVLGNGTFRFPNVLPGSYILTLSTASGVPGELPPFATLPNGWINTGEKLGLTPGRDPVVNGKLNVNVSTTNVINANFGIQISNGDGGIN